MPGAVHQFRAIPERARLRGRTENFLGTYAEDGPALHRLNAAGYGIFVAVNETTGTKDPDVTDIRCVFADIDRADEKELAQRLLTFTGPPVVKSFAGLAPITMIVESSPGKYHVYWKTHAMPLDRFKPFQQELAHALGGDHAVCNLSRVMRLPGFLYWKAEPFLTRIQFLRSAHPSSISAANLERALERVKKKFKVAATLKPKKVFTRAIEFNLAGIDGLLSGMSAAEPGNRNSYLFWAACRLAEQHASEDAFVLLDEAAGLSGLARREITATIASAMRRTAA
ncbi:MAG: DNA-primase RepB domain-containing protein [Methylocella sp.]